MEPPKKPPVHAGKFVPDSNEQSVEIPVRTTVGGFVEFPNKRLPHFKEGWIARLIIPAQAFEKEEEALRYLKTDTRMALKKGAGVVIALGEGGRVEVKLEDDLYMTMRGAKLAFCEPVRCLLVREKAQAESLNQAYTIASELYEKGRRSHGGSIFRNVHYEASPGIWEPLEHLRDTLFLHVNIAGHERE
jgi:hypothetical protein